MVVFAQPIGLSAQCPKCGSVISGFAVNKRLVFRLDRALNHPFLGSLRITCNPLSLCY